jgi:hypothetical protein
MATAQTLLDAGLNRSVSNDAGKLTTDTELLGVLSRKLSAYMALLSLGAADRGMTKTTVGIAGAPPFGSIPADAVDLRRVEGNAGEKVTIIPASEKDRSWHLAPCVYRVGQLLYSRALTGDPVTGDTLTLYYDDAPLAITALSDTIDARFPAQCHELLVLDLALYASAKDEGRNPSEYERLTKERDFHWQVFTALTGSASGALTSPHGRPAPEKA